MDNIITFLKKIKSIFFCSGYLQKEKMTDIYGISVMGGRFSVQTEIHLSEITSGGSLTGLWGLQMCLFGLHNFIWLNFIIKIRFQYKSPFQLPGNHCLGLYFPIAEIGWSWNKQYHWEKAMGLIQVPPILWNLRPPVSLHFLTALDSFILPAHFCLVCRWQ